MEGALDDVRHGTKLALDFEFRLGDHRTEPRPDFRADDDTAYPLSHEWRQHADSRVVRDAGNILVRLGCFHLFLARRSASGQPGSEY